MTYITVCCQISENSVLLLPTNEFLGGFGEIQGMLAEEIICNKVH